MCSTKSAFGTQRRGDVEFHQEVWGDLDVERLGQVGAFSQGVIPPIRAASG